MAKKQVWRQVFQRIRPYWGMLAISFLLAAVQVAMHLYIPILVGSGIDCIVAAGQVDFIRLSVYFQKILLCTAVAALSQWGMGELNNRVAYLTTRDMRIDAFAHIQKLPVSYLDKHPQGDIVNRVISDVDAFAEGLLLGFSQLFTGVITILGTLVIMLTIGWQIALFVVCVTPLSLLIANFIGKSTYSLFHQQSRIKGEQTAQINETVGNIKLVQSFAHGSAALEEFDKTNEELEKCALKAIFYSSLVNPTTRFVYALVYAGVGLLGGFMTIGGVLSVGRLTSLLSYANQYTKPFNEISGVITELQNAVACAGRVFELLAVTPIPEEPESQVQPENVQGNVEISHMAFSYNPEKPLLQDINLSVQPGQKIAIVGPTGCGKTTLINLLMRFYDPDDGSIRIDGVDTKSIPRRTLRRCVGMVLQDTWLKAGTIRDNIAMGKPDATMEEVVAAAKQSHAHSFIKRLPNGYDTVIGQQGGNLSQGQKQLLCIARVMLCLPPMLFLDEATSSIDTRTEAQVQQAFDVLMKGRTSFVVAHRLSTIQEADLILVMKDGAIVEQGTHTELLRENGFYAQLHKSQFTYM